ncbi:hypothetical protein [Aeromonas intestinalis]
MSLDIEQVAILRRVFQVEPKPSRGGVMITPPTSEQEHTVHYIRVTPDFDDMLMIDFITKHGKDIVASGFFHEEYFYVCDDLIQGWEGIDLLAQLLSKNNWRN